MPRAMDFNDLEAGADPNEGIAPHPSGEPALTIPALHQAARRMCSGELATLLIAHGADGTAVYEGHSAYALARMLGNRAVATALETAGQISVLDRTEKLVTAAADSETTGRINPADLSDETRRILCRIVGMPGRLDHVKDLQAIGIDPDWTDEMGMPAIHFAGWEGIDDAVAWLMTFDPDLSRKNDYGGDLLGTIIHGAEFCPARGARNHIDCARMVLEKGAALRRSEIDMCGDEEMAGFLADWAQAHPATVVEDRST